MIICRLIKKENSRQVRPSDHRGRIAAEKASCIKPQQNLFYFATIEVIISLKVGRCPSFFTLLGFPHPYDEQWDTKARLTENNSTANYVFFLCTIYNLIINIVIFL